MSCLLGYKEEVIEVKEKRFEEKDGVWKLKPWNSKSKNRK